MINQQVHHLTMSRRQHVIIKHAFYYIEQLKHTDYPYPLYMLRKYLPDRFVLKQCMYALEQLRSNRLIHYYGLMLYHVVRQFLPWLDKYQFIDFMEQAKSLLIMTESTNRLNVFNLYIGIAYLKVHEYSSARDILLQVSRSFLLMHNHKSYIEACTHIALLQSQLDLNDEAIYYSQLALSKAEQIEDTELISYQLLIMGKLYFRMHFVEKAFLYFHRGIMLGN